jgi:type IV fimbrial biogenesis protein FimT
MSPIHRRSRQRGFSLYELMVTLAIAGGLTTGATALGAVVQQQRLSAEANQFIGELSLARSEAIKRGQEMTYCPSQDGQQCDRPSDFTWWDRGVLLFADDNDNGRVDEGEVIVRLRSSLEGVQIKSSRARKRVQYHANGMAGGSNITFTLCAKADTEARYVIISNTGRPRVASAPPDGRADEPLERCS